MTKGEFKKIENEFGFVVAMRNLEYESYEITRLDTLKMYLSKCVAEEDYYLVEHLAKYIQNIEGVYNSNPFILYDYSLGTLDYPIRVDSFEDIEHLLD